MDAEQSRMKNEWFPMLSNGDEVCLKSVSKSLQLTKKIKGLDFLYANEVFVTYFLALSSFLHETKLLTTLINLSTKV